MPKFSIIIPVYNVEDYIIDCLDSIRKQTFQDIQVIMINDGSTDKSYEIIQSYLNKYGLSYEVYTKENEGQSKTRNIGVEYAKGEYLCFIDSDDFIEHTLLEKVNECILQYSSEMIRVPKKCFNHERKNFYNIDHYDNIYQMKGENFFRYCRKRHLMLDPVWLYVIKTQFWKTNNFQFAVGKIYEDSGLLPYVLMCASKISSINDAYYCYRKRPNSTITSYSEKKNMEAVEMQTYHYRYLVKQLSSLNIAPVSKEYYIQYISDAILGRYVKLTTKEREEVSITKQEITNILKQYPIINYRGVIKKMIYIIKLR